MLNVTNKKEQTVSGLEGKELNVLANPNGLNMNGLDILINTGTQKEIARKYVVNVFTDYSISFEEVKIPLDLPGAIRLGSVRISHSIAVLMTMEKEVAEAKRKGEPINYVKVYNRAISKVSAEMGIGATSCRDKLERRLSLSARDIVQLIEDYFENGSMNLRDILFSSVKGTKTEHEDTQAIEIYFSKKWF